MHRHDPLNLSDTEFDAVMVDIDEKLRQISDRIPGRELSGLAQFCAHFKVQLSNIDATSHRIFDWFERMYGDRLHLEWNFGCSVAIIQGDLYRFQCVQFFGTMLLICSPSTIGKEFVMHVEDGRMLPIHNLLDGRIEGLTPQRAERLSSGDCNAILQSYKRTFEAFSALEMALGAPPAMIPAPYIKEAIHDLVGSAESLMTSRPNYGQSKWDSLQAVEKVVKSCILEKGGTHKKSHGLAGLVAEAEKLGAPVVDQALIDDVQCAADVRYNSAIVGKAEAVAAHYAALTVCGHLAPMLKRSTSRTLAMDIRLMVQNRESMNGVMLKNI